MDDLIKIRRKPSVSSRYYVAAKIRREQTRHSRTEITKDKITLYDYDSKLFYHLANYIQSRKSAKSHLLMNLIDPFERDE